MKTLEDFRYQHDKVLRTKYGIIMPMCLAAGMIRGGDCSGGKDMIAVVDLRTGKAGFESKETLVEEIENVYKTQVQGTPAPAEA